MIVVGTLCAALIGYWVSAPAWMPDSLAIIIGSLALVLTAARGRKAQFAGGDGASDQHWIAQELAGKGTPSGFYLLGFFGFVTIMLTGVEGAYAMPAWAGLALGIAWGIANARYSTEDDAQS